MATLAHCGWGYQCVSPIADRGSVYKTLLKTVLIFTVPPNDTTIRAETATSYNINTILSKSS